MSANPEYNGTTSSRYTIPGEHVFEGMVFGKHVPAQVLSRVRNFKFHDSDVVIATYPKSGTTWMQEIVDLVQHNGDINRSKTIPLIQRSPFLEVGGPEVNGKPYFVIDDLETTAPPRNIKTHLPASFFEKPLSQQTKFVVVYRDIRDTLVSYYHFYQMNTVFGNFQGSWDEFFQLYQHKLLCHGDWFDYNLSWWGKRTNPNIIFFKYEDMKEDPIKEIERLAKFLDKKLSADNIKIIADQTSFKSMKTNPMTNFKDMGSMRQEVSPFIRKGIVGDWVNYFTSDQLETIQKHMNEKLAGTQFPYTF